jgi:hypothetical protein
MDVLWPDRGPDAAANNLNQAVHVARRALGTDVIEVRDELIALAADVEVDVDRFEQAAQDALRMRTPAACRAAGALNGGELLPENRYDDWAIGRRDELAELYHALADAPPGLGAAERLSSLPASASSFVGRDHELTELRALLAGTRLLTLAGTGGAGTTRLALELARGAEASYADGAALVELAAVADPRLVPDAVAAVLDRARRPALGPARRRRQLRDRDGARVRAASRGADRIRRADLLFRRRRRRVAPVVPRVVAGSARRRHRAHEPDDGAAAACDPGGVARTESRRAHWVSPSAR